MKTPPQTSTKLKNAIGELVGRKLQKHLYVDSGESTVEFPFKQENQRFCYVHSNRFVLLIANIA